jgi:hypothetical protein
MGGGRVTVDRAITPVPGSNTYFGVEWHYYLLIFINHISFNLSHIYPPSDFY